MPSKKSKARRRHHQAMQPDVPDTPALQAPVLAPTSTPAVSSTLRAVSSSTSTSSPRLHQPASITNPVLPASRTVSPRLNRSVYSRRGFSAGAQVPLRPASVPIRSPSTASTAGSVYVPYSAKDLPPPAVIYHKGVPRNRLDVNALRYLDREMHNAIYEVPSDPNTPAFDLPVFEDEEDNAAPGKPLQPHFWLLHTVSDGIGSCWPITSCGSDLEKKQKFLAGLRPETRQRALPLDTTSTMAVASFPTNVDTVAPRFNNPRSPEEISRAQGVTGFLLLTKRVARFPMTSLREGDEELAEARGGREQEALDLNVRPLATDVVSLGAEQEDMLPSAVDAMLRAEERTRAQAQGTGVQMRAMNSAGLLEKEEEVPPLNMVRAGPRGPREGSMSGVRVRGPDHPTPTASSACPLMRGMGMIQMTRGARMMGSLGVSLTGGLCREQPSGAELNGVQQPGLMPSPRHLGPPMRSLLQLDADEDTDADAPQDESYEDETLVTPPNSPFLNQIGKLLVAAADGKETLPSVQFDLSFVDGVV
ncbi:hypothetical protein C8R47DRAFT_1222711 [Mycena vitilis]|nr:hypothetical protein C8R47DRAFT_1222711 [Mycena vitilis]